jgi:hypothetical protein
MKWLLACARLSGVAWEEVNIASMLLYAAGFLWLSKYLPQQFKTVNKCAEYYSE